DPDTTVDLDLTIRNTGTADLDWTISEAEALGATVDFTGDFDVANWTTVNTPPEVAGSVNTAAAPACITVIGGGAGTGGTTDFEITIPDTGTMTFERSYASLHEPGFDSANYVVNGTATQLSDTDGQSGSVSLPLNAGDVFAFRVATDDGVFGAGEM